MGTKEGIRREAQSGGCLASIRCLTRHVLHDETNANCIDALGREGIPSSPTEHTITEHTSRSSPRFDPHFHSDNPFNLPTAISTLSVLEADLVNLDLTYEAFSTDPGQ
ncbi:hypothetical protein LOD99_9855 [Oopsacas minuta]|uniref:Uncharacterized protein n=1 Tax=Oopsacas minuta TaxID=111878 RepID=A0AAV7KKC9_9METZ|nr:hypothetical protein LOD99_9855 [Oopsacas minuta]